MDHLDVSVTERATGIIWHFRMREGKALWFTLSHRQSINVQRERIAWLWRSVLRCCLISCPDNTDDGHHVAKDTAMNQIFLQHDDRTVPNASIDLNSIDMDGAAKGMYRILVDWRRYLAG